MRRNAFTLVELLVVVGIIGLLIALLLPALQRVRAQAVTTACASNLRQIYFAANAYADDKGGRLPGVESGEFESKWIMRLTPYLGTRDGKSADEVVHCPAIVQDQLAAPFKLPIPKMTYGVNSYINLPQWQGRRSARMDTSRIILMGDKGPGFEDWLMSEDGGYFDPGNQATLQMQTHRGDKSRRHGGGRLANMLMVDGHVAAMGAAQLSIDSGHWHWGGDIPREVIPFCPCSTE